MAKEELSTLNNILDAGRAEFLERGFKSASLRNIVKTAGVTTGAFYGYFSGKEALFAALVEEHAKAIMNIFMSAQESFEELSDEEKIERIKKEKCRYAYRKNTERLCWCTFRNNGYPKIKYKRKRQIEKMSLFLCVVNLNNRVLCWLKRTAERCMVLMQR